MKNIFELITAVLGMSICILSAQIPTDSWTAFSPFHYFYPYSEHETVIQQQKVVDDLAKVTPFASELDGRSVIDRIAILILQRQLADIRKVIAQLATKSELDVIRTQLDEKATKSELTAFQLATKSKLDAIQTQLDEKATKSELTTFQLATKSKLDAIQTELDAKATKSDLEKTNSDVASIDSNLQKLTHDFESATAVVNIGHIPESCADLKTIGYKMNGVFQIKGTKQIENVFCDFTTNAQVLQKLIGYSDIKSASVYFYVQRSSIFNSIATPIPFELEVINEGKAMDLLSGKFKAPRPGIYFFTFTALAAFPTSTDPLDLTVGLYLNGNEIGANGAAVPGGNEAIPFTIQSTLKLKLNDEVWVQIDSATNSDVFLFGFSYNHFTGLILEEDIVASL